MGGVRRVAKHLVQLVLYGLVLLLILGAFVWFYEGGRYGQGPSILSWIVAVLALVVLSAMVLTAMAKLLGWSDGTVGRIVLIPCVVGLVAAIVWVRVQEDPLAEALRPACHGEPVPGAGDATGPAPLRIVVLGSDGERIDWTDHDADWRATRVEDAVLVACVERDDTVIETCNYTGGSDVTRYADAVWVRVMAARTGEAFGSFTLNGPAPRACESSEEKSLTRLDGDDVPFETLSARLATYANSGVATTTTAGATTTTTTDPDEGSTTTLAAPVQAYLNSLSAQSVSVVGFLTEATNINDAWDRRTETGATFQDTFLALSDLGDRVATFREDFVAVTPPPQAPQLAGPAADATSALDALASAAVRMVDGVQASDTGELRRSALADFQEAAQAFADAVTAAAAAATQPAP